MNRVPDWEHRFARFIEERRTMPFKWGVNDCCLFSADFVARITLYDFAEDFRGRYTTANGARRALLRSGAKDVEELMALYECIMFPRQPVMMAQRGDIVSYDSDIWGATLGVCNGVKSIFVGENGLEFYSTIECRSSWRI